MIVFPFYFQCFANNDTHITDKLLKSILGFSCYPCSDWTVFLCSSLISLFQVFGLLSKLYSIREIMVMELEQETWKKFNFVGHKIRWKISKCDKKDLNNIYFQVFKTALTRQICFVAFATHQLFLLGFFIFLFLSSIKTTKKEVIIITEQ